MHLAQLERKPMRQHRNPLYAPEYLERKLSPSGFLSIPVPTAMVSVPVPDPTDPPPPPLPGDLPPIVPAGPDGPA